MKTASDITKATSEGKRMGQNLNLAGIFLGAATSVSASILDFLKVTNEWVRELSPPIALVSGILAIFVAIKHLKKKEQQ